MNIALHDLATRSAIPDAIEETLEEGICTTLAFNRWGTLLAAGCNDGRIVIYDFVTREIAKQLIGHVHPVTKVSWSRNGHNLLTSSMDYTVKFWDVITCKEKTFKFDAGVMKAFIHPRGKRVFLVCPFQEKPQLVYVDTNKRLVLPEEPIYRSRKKKAQNTKKNSAATAFWNYTGDRIYTGNEKGVVTVIDTDTVDVITSFNVPAPVLDMVFSRDRRQYLISTTDRVIRLHNTDDNSMLHEFTDSINKIQWKACAFSADREHVIGGSAEKAEHKIYMWNRTFGNIAKMLEGPKEGIIDMVWHPTRPIIASASASTGVIYIWNAHYKENWSAFAPGFEELEDNAEYLEKEDEYDKKQNTAKKQGEEESDNEELDVDILTIEKNPELSSEGEDDLSYIPVAPVPDIYNEKRMLSPLVLKRKRKETQTKPVKRTKKVTKET